MTQEKGEKKVLQKSHTVSNFVVDYGNPSSPPQSSADSGTSKAGHKVGTGKRRGAKTQVSAKAHWTSCPRLLPLKAAAEYLGLTVWALRERIWAGALPVVQFPGGRKQYLDVRDLDGFVEANKRVIA